MRRRGRPARRKADKQRVGEVASKEESGQAKSSRSKPCHRSECMSAKVRTNEQRVGEVGQREGKWTATRRRSSQ